MTAKSFSQDDGEPMILENIVTGPNDKEDEDKSEEAPSFDEDGGEGWGSPAGDGGAGFDR